MQKSYSSDFATIFVCKIERQSYQVPIIQF